MKIKCVFRDMMGLVRIIDLEAGSPEEATIGLHDKCRDAINALDTVDKSKIMVWLEYLIDDTGNHYRIVYSEGPFGEEEAGVLQSLGEETVFISEPVFEHEGEAQQYEHS
jgi:hypothetical protein